MTAWGSLRLCPSAALAAAMRDGAAARAVHALTLCRCSIADAEDGELPDATGHITSQNAKDRR